MKQYQVHNGLLYTVDDDGALSEQPFYKTPGNHDTWQESERCALTCEDPSLTDGSHKEDVDINVIVKRAREEAFIPVVLPEHFGDATLLPTYQQAHEAILENNRTFYLLTPEVRARFSNRPELWADEVRKQLDNGNLKELAEMGIDVELIPKPPVTPQAATPAPGATAPTPPPPAAGGPPATTDTK